MAVSETIQKTHRDYPDTPMWIADPWITHGLGIQTLSMDYHWIFHASGGEFKALPIKGRGQFYVNSKPPHLVKT